MRRWCYPSRVFDETSVETAKSTKWPHFGNVLWSFPVAYCYEKVVIWCNTFWAQLVSLVSYGFFKDASNLGFEFDMLQRFNNKALVFLLLFHILAKKFLPKTSSRNMRTNKKRYSLKMLKMFVISRWKVSETLHSPNGSLKVLVRSAVGGGERSFWYCFLSRLKLPVSWRLIEAWENRCSVQMIQYMVNSRKRKSVFLR